MSTVRGANLNLTRKERNNEAERLSEDCCIRNTFHGEDVVPHHENGRGECLMMDGKWGYAKVRQDWTRCRRCGKHPVFVAWKFLRGAKGLPPEAEVEPEVTKGGKPKPRSRWRTMGYAHCACLTTDWEDVDLRTPEGVEGLRNVWEGMEESGVDAVEVAPEGNETEE